MRFSDGGEAWRLSRRESIRLGTMGIVGLTAAPMLLMEAMGAEPCVQSVPETDLTYYLVALDKYGRERPWPGGLCSSRVIRQLTARPITDVFIFMHGWMGDVVQAKSQYDAWISAMTRWSSDAESMRDVRPEFLPLLIGIHWPSLPFGDEELRAAALETAEVGGQLDEIAEGFADTPKARRALQTILEAARRPETERLPAEVANAFRVLQAEGGLQTDGAWAAPGADAERFDPQEMYEGMKETRALLHGDAAAASAEGRNYTLLYLLASVSYWTMKSRARAVGESGGHQLLAALQAAVPAGRSVQFHLMGHSFGCIVASAMLQGPPRGWLRIRPVNSVSLMQGALSLWSFSTNAANSGRPGYFRPIVDRRLVSGPIITTQSNLDYAVKHLYPLAAGIAQQLYWGEANARRFPKYGGVGVFGIQGDGCNSESVEILLDKSKSYGFKPGTIYNLECTSVIKELFPLSGAHSDIAHPEVAHAVWEAARVGAGAAQLDRPVPIPVPPIPRLPEPSEPRRRIFRRKNRH